MDLATDLGAIAELAAHAPSLVSYERELLSLLERRVGFDVAMCKRNDGLGAHAPGLDHGIRRACEPDWPIFHRELTPLRRAGKRGLFLDPAMLSERVSSPGPPESPAHVRI